MVKFFGIGTMRTYAFRWFCFCDWLAPDGHSAFGPGKSWRGPLNVTRATNRRTWGIRRTGVRGTY